MRRALGTAFFFLSTGLVLHAQMADRCSPGWSMLNQLREQLTPETPQETLELLHVTIAKRLENCRAIPDLWYYRAIVSERVHDVKDAAFARREAASRGSQALLGKINPFEAEAPVAAAPLSATIGEKYALVVGINEFEHANSLRFAVNDAESVADLLADPQVGRFRKSNIFRLMNGEATLQGVKTAIGEIRARAKENDLIVVYIASHGSPREEDPNGVSYILMHDTKFNDAADLYATSLQMIYLVDILKRDVRAKRVALILDTCFSGDATSSRGVVVHTPSKAVGPAADFSVAADRIEDKAPDGAARVVISASRANEQSLEDNGHGYFTRFLLDALRQNGGGNSMRDVFQVVHDRTVEAVRERFGARGLTQTPTLRSTPAGLDIILGAKAAAQ